MITNTSNSYTITTSTKAPQAAYFSTLDAAFVYIREYIEDNIGENISVCVKETTLCINGKEQDLYEVSFGTAQQYVLPQAPYIPYAPQVPDIAPQAPQDEWWKSPYVYCGPTPPTTLGSVGQVESVPCINAAQQTKAGCIAQSYETAPQA